jgi:hypothetical protein
MQQQAFLPARKKIKNKTKGICSYDRIIVAKIFHMYVYIYKLQFKIIFKIIVTKIFHIKIIFFYSFKN